MTTQPRMAVKMRRGNMGGYPPRVLRPTVQVGMEWISKKWADRVQEDTEDVQDHGTRTKRRDREGRNDS